jgi:arginine/ornithine N-succinyltransferase beta subunit
VIAEFYMKGNLQASEKLEQLAKFWDLTLGNDFLGNSEIMTMSAIPLTVNAAMFGVISFKEYE